MAIRRRCLLFVLLALACDGGTAAPPTSAQSSGGAAGSGTAGSAAGGQASAGSAGASVTTSGGASSGGGNTSGGNAGVAGSAGNAGATAGGAKFDTSGAVLAVDFEASPLGGYSQEQVAIDWGIDPPWNDGLDEGRADIVDDGAAYGGGRSLRILYPQGSVGPGEGGAQFIIDLPQAYDELYVAYRISFAQSFDFVKGGKIPGPSGGADNTGGDKPTGSDGWSGRMMWREGGKAVTYLYHPDQPTQYGEDLDWALGEQRYFAAGEWHVVEHRVVMNTPAQHDGVVECWFDGELALQRSDIRFRDVSTFAIESFYFSTFFGGSDSTWAAAKDEYAYFDDFVIATQPITH